MSQQKIYQGLLIFYVVVIFFLAGLIINKFTYFPKPIASPTVSYGIDVTEKTSPEKLAAQFADWVKMDSKSILINGIPTMGGQKNGGILDQVLEPKNIFEYLIYWTLGINFNQPETYLASGLPGLRMPVEKPAAIAVSTNSSPEGPVEVAEPVGTPTGPKVIKSDNGEITLNVTEAELLENTDTHPEDVKVVEDQTPATTPDASGKTQSSETTTPKADTPKVEPQTSGKTNKTPTAHKPRVLIYHTHGSETYDDDKSVQDNLWHTISSKGHVMDVGDAMAAELKKQGIEVVHDSTIYDRPFDKAYTKARSGISKQLRSDSYDVVIDLHRDAKPDFGKAKGGSGFKISGKSAARVMLIVTKGRHDITDKTAHANWQTNYRFGKALATDLQKMYPGLLQLVDLRPNKVFNQDLHSQAILIEVGSQRNTTAEAVYTGKLLAKVFAELLHGDSSFLLD